MNTRIIANVIEDIYKSREKYPLKRHVFFFSGIHGVGKTTLARELDVHLLKQQHSKGIEPFHYLNRVPLKDALTFKYGPQMLSNLINFEYVGAEPYRDKMKEVHQVILQTILHTLEHALANSGPNDVIIMDRSPFDVAAYAKLYDLNFMPLVVNEMSKIKPSYTTDLITIEGHSYNENYKYLLSNYATLRNNFISIYNLIRTLSKC